MTPAQTRRLLLILAFIVIVIAILFLVWFLFFQALFQPSSVTNLNTNTAGSNGLLPNTNVNRPTNGNTNQPVAQGPGTLPSPAEVANGALTLTNSVSNKTAVAPIVGPDGTNLIFYSDIDAKFLRLDPATGNLTDVAPQKFPDVQNVTWAPDGERAVLEFPDDHKVIFDFQNQRQYSLPTEATDFSFSSDSKQLAYAFVGTDPNSSYLVTTKSDGTGSKAVAKLGDQTGSVEVAWSPTNEVVGLYHKSANATQQEVIFIGQNQENFKSLTTDGKGFQGKWTPDGKKLLYTVYSEETNWNPELHLVYAQGDSIGTGDVNLGLQTTLSKCTFNRAGTFAYCAVPDLMERGSGLYPEFSSTVKDTIYTINLTSGSVQPLAQPVTAGLDRFTVGTLMLTPDESTLYFTDQATRKILKIRLR